MTKCAAVRHAGREAQAAPTVRAVVRQGDSSERGVVGHESAPEHAGAVSPAPVGRATINPLTPDPGDLLVPHEIAVGGSETVDVRFGCRRGRRSSPLRPIPKHLDPVNRVRERTGRRTKSFVFFVSLVYTTRMHALYNEHHNR